MSTNRIGKSYDYRVICDVCGFKKWNYELRKRWDGLMVCKEDWEPRNFLDFYRTRNDAHRLPYTRPDGASNGTTWTPVFTGFTISGGFASIVDCAYLDDPTTKKFSYSLVLVLGVNPCTVASAATVSLPTGFTVATDNGGTVRGSKSGVFYSKTTASGTSITVSTGFTITPPDSILINGSFTTT